MTNSKGAACIEALLKVLELHGFTLSHEDGHGAFRLLPRRESVARNEMWLRQARIEGDGPVNDSAVVDLAMKAQATRFILNVLRSPIALMTRPMREEALELAKRFEVTAADLIELAAGRARDT